MVQYWIPFRLAPDVRDVGKVWGYTQCVSPIKGGCASRSPHMDWYHGLTDIVDQLNEEIKEKHLMESSQKS